MTTIIIDAGHGPNTPGKRSPDGTLREFTFNLAVANELVKLLQKKNIKTVTTHHSLRDISLSERVQKANATNGDLFISIHANAASADWHLANGIETYIQKNASESEKEVATLVQASLIQKTGLRNRGVKEENFYVLVNTQMPSILIECGFMTNPKEVKLLLSTSFQKRCATAILEGILRYFQH